MRKLTIILMFLFALLAMSLRPADNLVIPASQGKKACTFAVGFKTLSVYYEKVLVIAEKPNINKDTGEARPEWWILNLENPQKHQRGANGLPIALNVPKEEVLFVNPKDGPVMVVHQMKVCRCPPMYWGMATNSGFSAEHK